MTQRAQRRPRTQRTPRTQRDSGFTLIELAVAVSILGVVMGALVGVFVALLRLAPTTGSSFSESHDAQLAASYWVTDVQSADSVSTGSRTCPASPAGTTPVVSFQWSSAGAVKLAVYQRRRPISGGPRQEDLVRTFCVMQDGALAATPLSTVIARRVQPVKVLCDTPSCASPVATSKLTVTEASGYTFTVAGTRRVATRRPAP